MRALTGELLVDHVQLWRGAVRLVGAGARVARILAGLGVRPSVPRAPPLSFAAPDAPAPRPAEPAQRPAARSPASWAGAGGSGTPQRSPTPPSHLPY
jgi:hypothetical protein